MKLQTLSTLAFGSLLAPTLAQQCPAQVTVTTTTVSTVTETASSAISPASTQQCGLTVTVTTTNTNTVTVPFSSSSASASLSAVSAAASSSVLPISSSAVAPSVSAVPYPSPISGNWTISSLPVASSSLAASSKKSCSSLSVASSAVAASAASPSVASAPVASAASSSVVSAPVASSSSAAYVATQQAAASSAAPAVSSAAPAASSPASSAVAASSSSSPALGGSNAGQATFYGGNLNGGTCSFTTMSSLPAGVYGTALSIQNWDSAANCGACVSVTGPSGNKITAMVSFFSILILYFRVVADDYEITIYHISADDIFLRRSLTNAPMPTANSTTSTSSLTPSLRLPTHLPVSSTLAGTTFPAASQRPSPSSTRAVPRNTGLLCKSWMPTNP